MATEITHEPAKSRYVLTVDGEEAGEATYVLEGDMHVFDHTYTDPARRGQGLAGRLVEHALTDVRARGGRVRPVCPFVVTYMDEHPEFTDIRA